MKNQRRNVYLVGLGKEKKKKKMNIVHCHSGPAVTRDYNSSGIVVFNYDSGVAPLPRMTNAFRKGLVGFLLFFPLFWFFHPEKFLQLRKLRRSPDLHILFYRG